MGMWESGWSGRRRHSRSDTLVLALVAAVVVLVIALIRPTESTAESSSPVAIVTAPTAADSEARTRRADAPDQWARGITIDLERIRPAPTATSQPTPTAAPESFAAAAGAPPAPPDRATPVSRGATNGAGTATGRTLGARVPEVVRRWEEPILRWSAARNLEPNLVAAVIMTESEGNPNAVSPMGAVGLMQVMRGPFDPDENIRMGTGELAGYIVRYGKIDVALAAYNAGPGAVDKYGGIPPYQETRNHVFRVLLRYDLYNGS
jgi:soluble lytic murein transglycosylase-like protein